jgi:hypothetical protein
MDVCKRQAPPNVVVASDHIAACWLHVDPAERGAGNNGVPADAGTAVAKN